MHHQSIIRFAIISIVRILTALAVIKILAWELGAAGFGLISQLMAVVAITGMLAGGGTANGVIKTLSSNPADTEAGREWMNGALFITFATSAIVALVLIMGAPVFSKELLEGKYVPMLVMLGIAQAFTGVGSLILAESSSRKDSRTYAQISITSICLGTIAIVSATYFGAEDGAATAIVLAPALTGLVGLLVLGRERRSVLFFMPKYDREKIRELLSYASLTLVGALSVPVAQIMIRDTLGQAYSWESVGYWQGAVKISDVYMQFIGVVLINNALPRFSSANVSKALSELRSILILLMALLIGGFSIMLATQDIIVSLVFTDSFMPVKHYFLPQMGGDIFRTVAAAISYFLLSRGIVSIPLIFELTQGLFLYGIFLLLKDWAGMMSPVYAHLVSYAILTMFMGMALKWCLTEHSTLK